MYSQQSKDTILTYLDSLDDEELFCDPDFNADRFALFYSDKDASCFQWKRPVVKFCYIYITFNILTEQLNWF